MASGSPSMALIANVLQTTVAMADFGYDIETAVHLPHFGYFEPDGSQIVENDFGAPLLDALRARGITTREVGPWYWLNGSFEGIVVEDDGTLAACGDPRRNSEPAAA